MTQPVVDYGTDFFGTNDLDPTLRMVTGRLCLSQALYRRLVTTRGNLFYDLNYGIDVRGWVNDGLTNAGAVARKAARIDRELVKDQRVIASKTNGTFTAGILRFTTLITDGNGPFTLVIDIDSITATLVTPSSQT